MKNWILVPILLFGIKAMSQDNIADARTYLIGQTVTVTGIVTNGDEFDAVRYIQDETAGIALYPGSDWSNLDFTPEPGDNITITGELTEFSQLLEIGPNITSLVLNSSGNPLPAPITLTPDEINEDYEGMLIEIIGAVFADGGSAFGVSTYNFTSDEEQAVVYIPSGSPIIGELVPFGIVDFTGILSQYSFTSPVSGYQILPRLYSDFIFSSAINLTSEVEQSNLSTSGFDLSWSTDLGSTTEVAYGLTPELGTVQSIEENAIDHSVSLENLASGTPYFCQVFSVTGEDTARSAIRVYSTVSESSGEIRAYFNRSVDTDYATIEEAHSLFDATDDTIIACINRAQTTLDIAVYNNNSGPIVQAINDAYDRGVNIRYIAEGQTANSGLNSLNAAIPTFERQGALSSGMHNKFLVVDRNNVDSALVLTGSTNWTSNNLFSDPNNMVIIQDQALARAYTLEFNEMWGSDGDTPDAITSRFGEFKINNTPEKFIIGGVDVELYFSPSDNTTNAIEAAIQATEYDLDFALLLITNNTLADAVMDQVSIFVTPRGIIEDPNQTGSDFDELLANGVDLVSHQGIPGQLHHKYGIIDHSQPLADPTVITGSHNWSGSAESTNDENTLIIHDARIANLFYQEFRARLAEASVGVENLDQLNLKLFPNPASNEVRLKFEMKSSSALTVRILDMSGKEVFSSLEGTMSGSVSIAVDLSNLNSGVYLLALESETGSSYKKLVVKH